jgi:iron complex outermembrane recepter protein
MGTRIHRAVLILALGAACGAHAQEPADITAPAAAGAPTAPPQTVDTVPVNEEAPAREPEPDAVTLDAVEVTAQRRRQRLVDVPVAVTAMTQDQVDARRIERLDDLNSLAPGLQVSRSPSNTTISQLTIRGSSQINPAIYWDPAVGVYLDGVYLGKGQGSIFNIVDIAGVEVLRGPQGTLYGRNTIAGTINFVTREPSGNFIGNVGLELGEFNQRVYKASVDLPRVGILAATLGARVEERDPWIATTETSPVDGMNNRDNQGAHLGAVLDLWTGLEAVYHLDYGKTDQTNNFLQLVRYNDSPTCSTDCMSPYVSRQRRDTADINAPSAEFADILGHSFVLSWDATDWLTIKSITGQRDVKWVDKLDLDGSPNDVAHSERHTDYEQFSQDFNFTGRLGAFTWTAGYYLFTDEGFTNNPIFVSISGAPIYFDSRYGTEAEADGFYGQVDWNPIERLTLAAGIRQTNERKELSRVFGYTVDPNVPYTYYMPEGYRAPGADFSATTPMASVAWRFSEGLNVYARYAEGFKSGGFNGEYSNITSTDPVAEHERETNTPFRPEQQQSFELGAKTSWLDGKALVNVAAFQNKLEDLQVSIFTASGAAASVIRNAGKATVKGLELEAAFMPWQGTTLRGNYAWLDPVYDEFIDAVCGPPLVPGGAPQDCQDENVANNRAFVHAPESSWNLVLDSEFWNTDWGTLRGTLDYVWTDSFYTYPYQLAMPGDPPCQGGGEGGGD